MSNVMIPCYTIPPYTCTTPWWQRPYMMTTTQAYIEQDGGDDDKGMMYLWSPLMIFSVFLAVLVGVILIVLLAIAIYNYCTYGMCCCPGCSQQGSECSFCPMWCMPPQAQQAKCDTRRGSVTSYDSVRSRKPRQQIVIDDGRGDDADDVVVVSRPNIDRKVVRIADSPEVHTIRVRRRSQPEVTMAPQNLPQQQQPIILQPQIIVQPAAIQQPATPQYQPAPQPRSTFQGGELRVVIGNGQQQQQQNMGGGRKPLVFNMGMNNQPNEYVLTSVDGGGRQSGGGGWSSVGGGGGGGGGWSSGGGGGGGFTSGGGGGGWTSGGGGGGGGMTGFHGVSSQDDRGSSFSDGQRSAIIDIGHGTRNSFYPSLPRYDD